MVFQTKPVNNKYDEFTCSEQYTSNVFFCSYVDIFPISEAIVGFEIGVYSFLAKK